MNRERQSSRRTSNEFEAIHRDREDAVEARRRHQRAENNQLKENMRKLRHDLAQCQQGIEFLEHLRQQMVKDWERQHQELAASFLQQSRQHRL